MFGITTQNLDAESVAVLANGVRGRISEWIGKRAYGKATNAAMSERCKLVAPMTVPAYVFSKENEAQFKKLYGDDFTFATALALDNANAIFTSLSLETSLLSTPTLVVDEVTPLPCNEGELAKRYQDISALQADIERPPRFDRDLDPTYYENRLIYQAIIDSTDDLGKKIPAVAAELSEKTGMNSRKATQEASALILGYRPVDEGDYATVGDSLKFKWTGTEWLGQSDSSPTKIESACILQENCLVFNKACISTEGAPSAIAAGLVNQYAPGLMAVGQEERRTNNEQAIGRLPQLKQLRLISLHKSSLSARELGLTATIPESMDSPNLPILNRILAQGDFALRMLNIARFASAFTRGNLEGESRYWKYCNTTGGRLLPTFLATLAATFTNNEDYNETLSKIVASQGTLADDGEAIVDKETGWEITRIGFSADEGFDDLGLAIRSRDVLSKDISVTAHIPLSKPGPQAGAATNVINALAELTSVPINDDMELMLNEINLLMDRTMPTREEYEAALQKAKGKKRDSYEDAMDQATILYASAYFLLFAQTSLFMPRPRRTFPGCQRTFSGYPSGPITDTNGIVYISCVLAGLRTKERPWGSILKMKEKSLARKITKTLERYIVDTAVARERVLKKAEARVSDIIAPKVQTWATFLPPKYKGSILVLSDLSELESQLKSSVKSGSQNQFSLEGGIRHQIMNASIDIGLDIKDAVQTNVETDRFILTTAAGVPYVENACCSTTSTSTTHFLLSKKPTIAKYNSYARSAQAVLDQLDRRSTAPQIFDPTDTRLAYPEIPAIASKRTILAAFQAYCLDNPDLYETAPLLSICSSISDDALVGAERAKENLDASSLAYDTDKLDKLMSIVNSGRLVSIDVDASYDHRLDHFMRDLAESNLDEELKSRMTLSVQDPNKLDDVLETLNTLIQDGLVRYKATCEAYLSPKEFASQGVCLDSLFLGSSVQAILEDKSDDGDWGLKQSLIRAYGTILPNIVANSNSFVQDPPIPRHWDLSFGHSVDVAKMIRATYGDLSKFYNNPDLAATLNVVASKNEVVSRLAYNLAPGLGSTEGIPSMFTERMTNLFLEYLLIKELLNSLEAAKEYTGADTDTSRPRNALNAAPDVMSIDDELALGGKESLLGTACACSALFLEIICTMQNAVGVSYAEVATKALRGREKEKDLIIEYLTDMSDEAREVENIFKTHSLGRWSVGMQAGFKRYDKGMYDLERSDMDELAAKEREEGKSDAVTGMQADVFPELSIDDAISDNTAREMASYRGEDDNIVDEDFESEF